MNLAQALAYIHSTSWQGSRLGLDRMRQLMAALGNPQEQLRFVHVAGTNGKGSCCAMLNAILMAAGCRVGLYTSPHLERVNERMKINGTDVTDDALIALAEQVKAKSDAMEDKPTEFEVITAMALLYFQQQHCQLVLLEVGLGGELDATNIIPPPEVAVITALGLEHTRELGPALTDIAAAKAGIIKPGCTVVSYGSDAESVVAETCRRTGAEYQPVAFSRLHIRSAGLTGSELDFLPLTHLHLPLAGLHQCRNAALALTVAEVLARRGWAISPQAMTEGLAATSWPGRLETLRQSPLFLLDGAHNPHGIAAVAGSLRQYYPQGGLVFLLGILADKDVEQMLSDLCPLGRAFVTVTPPSPRALAGEDLAALIRQRGLPAHSAPTIVRAVQEAIDLAGPQGTVCALGSLYMSAHIRAAVEGTVH